MTSVNYENITAGIENQLLNDTTFQELANEYFIQDSIQTVLGSVVTTLEQDKTLSAEDLVDFLFENESSVLNSALKPRYANILNADVEGQGISEIKEKMRKMLLIVGTTSLGVFAASNEAYVNFDPNPSVVSPLKMESLEKVEVVDNQGNAFQEIERNIDLSNDIAQTLEPKTMYDFLAALNNTDLENTNLDKGIETALKDLQRAIPKNSVVTIDQKADSLVLSFQAKK